MQMRARAPDDEFEVTWREDCKCLDRQNSGKPVAHALELFLNARDQRVPPDRVYVSLQIIKSHWQVSATRHKLNVGVPRRAKTTQQTGQ